MYLIAIGFFSTFLIFNQIYVGTNVSLIWVAVIAAPLICDRQTISWVQAAVIVFLFAFTVKFLVFMNATAVVHYLIYIAFVGAAMISLRRPEFDLFFSGVQIGLACNIAFACFQMVGKLSGTYDAVFPIDTWNPSLWHVNPEGGMFLFYPRVSGFANEPAYLGTIVIMAAAYRLFVQKKQAVTGWYGLYLFLSIMALVNSRTAFVSYLWLVSCAILLRFEQHFVGRIAAYAVYVLSFVVMPLTIMYTTDGFGDYSNLLKDDISVFARTVPLTWIREGNNLSPANYFFGVGDYRSYAQAVNMPELAFLALDIQGGLLDPKSLGGAYFFDLGIVGLAAFIAAVGILCNGRVASLLLFSTININFFNVYAYSWPLFWLTLVICGLRPVQASKVFTPISDFLQRGGLRARRWAGGIAYKTE
jgi:hypothetical protein